MEKSTGMASSAPAVLSSRRLAAMIRGRSAALSTWSSRIASLVIRSASWQPRPRSASTIWRKSLRDSSALTSNSVCFLNSTNVRRTTPSNSSDVGWSMATGTVHRLTESGRGATSMSTAFEFIAERCCSTSRSSRATRGCVACALRSRNRNSPCRRSARILRSAAAGCESETSVLSDSPSESITVSPSVMDQR